MECLPGCLCTSTEKSWHSQLLPPSLIQCLLLENSSLKMLTSSHEQKQSRDGVYCDAESTGEINAPISSHSPSSLFHIRHRVKYRSEHAICGKTVKAKRLFASIGPGRGTQPLCPLQLPGWSGQGALELHLRAGMAQLTEIQLCSSPPLLLRGSLCC